MPCTGPSYDKKLPKRITEHFLKILKVKYRIPNGGFSRTNNGLEFDEKLKMDLALLVENIVKSDAYNGF